MRADRGARAVLERVGPDDWAAWRRLRLEALQDTPLGFVERPEHALALTEQQWRDRLARPEAAWLVRAAPGPLGVPGRPLAMALQFRDPAGCWLGSVYVTPTARGRGLLDLLVDAAADEARALGAEHLRLEVHEDNGRARAAYARRGFVETGHRRPYPLPPGGDELEMVLALRDRTPLQGPW